MSFGVLISVLEIDENLNRYIFMGTILYSIQKYLRASKTITLPFSVLFDSSLLLFVAFTESRPSIFRSFRSQMLTFYFILILPDFNYKFGVSLTWIDDCFYLETLVHSHIIFISFHLRLL